MSVHKEDRLKRCIDIVGAVLGLVVTAPVQLLVAIAVRIALGSPVLFRQERAGRHGKTFTLTKFRSMREVDPAAGMVSDADRLTPFGKVLRSTSLDELPSLWNVLRGDMSLVGPRPLRTYYLPRYSPEQARRHEVRPGVTGLAQISGRNRLPWEDRFRLDLEYIDRRSTRLDLSIMLRTLIHVLRRSSTTAAGHVTMTPFMGSERTADER